MKTHLRADCAFSPENLEGGPYLCVLALSLSLSLSRALPLAPCLTVLVKHESFTEGVTEGRERECPLRTAHQKFTFPPVLRPDFPCPAPPPHALLSFSAQTPGSCSDARNQIPKGVRAGNTEVHQRLRSSFCTGSFESPSAVRCSPSLEAGTPGPVGCS